CRAAGHRVPPRRPRDLCCRDRRRAAASERPARRALARDPGCRGAVARSCLDSRGDRVNAGCQGSILDAILDSMHHACMTRITGKFQITLPKRLVDSYGIRVGDEVEIVAAGESIAIIPARTLAPVLSAQERLRHFDQATRRQEARQRGGQQPGAATDRGWAREELYTRG